MNKQLEVRRPEGEFTVWVGGCILQEPIDVFLELLSGVGLSGGYLIESIEHGFIHRPGIVQKYSNDLLNSFFSMLVDGGGGVNVFHLWSVNNGMIDEGRMSPFRVEGDSESVQSILDITRHG
jgi:hypothetical protein